MLFHNSVFQLFDLAWKVGGKALLLCGHPFLGQGQGGFCVLLRLKFQQGQLRSGGPAAYIELE